MIQTANGTCDVKHEVKVKVDMLELEVWVSLLQDSPPVLALGLLTSEHGFDFLWKHDQMAVLKKNDVVYYCQPHMNVPIIMAGQETSSANARKRDARE